MRLARRLSLAISIGICLVLGVNAWLRVEQGRADYRADVERDHTGIGRGIAAAVNFVWSRDGQEVALDVVEQLNRRESHMTIRWVWPDAPLGHENAARRPDLIPAPKRRAQSHVVEHDGTPYMLTYVPVRAPGARAAAIELFESLEQEREALRGVLLRTGLTMLALLTVCVALTFGFGALLVARPLRALVAKAERIGAGDLSGPLELTVDNEVRDLAVAMNVMCERLSDARTQVDEETKARLRAMEQLRHADRLRTVGELASGIAHQVGTPLNVVRVRAEMIQGGEVSKERTRELGTIIIENVDRIADTIRQLLDFARREQSRLESGDVALILRDTLRLVDPLANHRRVALQEGSTVETAPARIDPGQIHQALTNIIVNSLQATPSGGQVTADLMEGSAGWVVQICDTGEGISSEHLPHLFEPFFTTKRAGEGTGLGLSVADEIIREHGGRIDVESSPQRGTTFRIHIPKLS